VDEITRIQAAHAAVARARKAMIVATKALDRAIAASDLGPRPLARALGISPTAASDLRTRALTGHRRKRH
jgi:hypothetical protein